MRRVFCWLIYLAPIKLASYLPNTGQNIGETALDRILAKYKPKGE